MLPSRIQGAKATLPKSFGKVCASDWCLFAGEVAAAKDYERMAPGSSFIHVDDFASIKELAQYLLKVDKDPHLGVV